MGNKYLIERRMEEITEKLMKGNQEEEEKVDEPNT